MIVERALINRCASVAVESVVSAMKVRASERSTLFAREKKDYPIGACDRGGRLLHSRAMRLSAHGLCPGRAVLPADMNRDSDECRHKHTGRLKCAVSRTPDARMPASRANGSA